MRSLARACSAAIAPWTVSSIRKWKAHSSASSTSTGELPSPVETGTPAAQATAAWACQAPDAVVPEMNTAPASSASSVPHGLGVIITAVEGEQLQRAAEHAAGFVDLVDGDLHAVAERCVVERPVPRVVAHLGDHDRVGVARCADGCASEPAGGGDPGERQAGGDRGAGGPPSLRRGCWHGGRCSCVHRTPPVVRAPSWTRGVDPLDVTDRTYCRQSERCVMSVTCPFRRCRAATGPLSPTTSAAC